jgi:hypothetical protein
MAGMRGKKKYILKGSEYFQKSISPLRFHHTEMCRELPERI